MTLSVFFARLTQLCDLEGYKSSFLGVALLYQSVTHLSLCLMAPISNPRVVFSAVPSGYPAPGRDITVNSSRSLDLDGPALNGGFITKTLWLSLDPYMRGRMDRTMKRYIPPWEIGDTYVHIDLLFLKVVIALIAWIRLVWL